MKEVRGGGGGEEFWTLKRKERTRSTRRTPASKFGCSSPILRKMKMIGGANAGVKDERKRKGG